MAASSSNPFDSLYVTETIDADSFVSVFSPFIVHDTSSLFEAGNVVLLGTQGSGKSMLLSLLKPETRVAYHKARVQFPLASEGGRKFIGGGVNLARSSAIDFGQRPLGGESDGAAAAAAYFADFLNCVIVVDMLTSLKVLGEYPKAAQEAGVRTVDAADLNEFARALASEDCWLGAFSDVRSYADLIEGINRRISHYRNFLNYNTDEVEGSIREKKTSAGEPVSVTAALLRSSGVIEDGANIFVRIDQYEDLRRLEEWKDAEFASVFASVIHKMLGLRDPRVSYRIGTRRDAWPERPRMQGTSAVLEELRNFKIVDLDEILTPKEHRRPFPKFAEDVFRRRVEWAGYRLGAKTAEGRGRDGLVREVFGTSPKPTERAELYVRSRSFVPRSSTEWSAKTTTVLERLAKESPLDCVLAEAYLLQRGEREFHDSGSPEPWSSRQWWRKERTGQALLQLAARQRQRMIWCGTDDIYALSGANILVFVSLCQSIWDAYLRTLEEPPALGQLPHIPDSYTQDEGIHQASRYWHRKVRSDPDGDSRLHFVNILGTLFRKWLREDVRLSYPGHNGFSLDGAELRADGEVRDFLNRATAYGVLVDRGHSTRNRGRGRRHKWYLAPIYSAHFQIPASHVKEPRYVLIEEVRDWLAEAEVAGFSSARSQPRSADLRQTGQKSLFGDDG